MLNADKGAGKKGKGKGKKGGFTKGAYGTSSQMRQPSYNRGYEADYDDFDPYFGDYGGGAP